MPQKKSNYQGRTHFRIYFAQLSFVPNVGSELVDREHHTCLYRNAFTMFYAYIRCRETINQLSHNVSAV